MPFDRMSDLIITKINGAATQHSDAGKSNRIINRPSWGILFKYSGETIYTCKGNRYISRQNSVIIAPAGCSYRFESITSGEFGWIDFDANLTHDDLIQISYQNSQIIWDTINRVDYLRISKPPLYQMSAIAEAYQLLVLLCKNTDHRYISSEHQRKLQPAMDYILHNYTHPLSNEDLAAQVGLSTSYFRKLFSEVYGTTPLSYLQRLRIQKAKEMLLSNTGSISEIAYSLGYHNIYDFSRAFKRAAGCSPTHYIQNKRAALP